MHTSANVIGSVVRFLKPESNRFNESQEMWRKRPNPFPSGCGLGTRLELAKTISNSSGSDHSSSRENPFDWSYEGLKERATGIFLPLEKDEILVKDSTSR